MSTPPSADQSLLYPPRDGTQEDVKYVGRAKPCKIPPFVWFLIGALIFSLIISLSAIPDDLSWMESLSNGRPAAGELGLGKFEIKGYNKSFVYPWRLQEKSTAARATAWTCYFLHQIGQYIIIYLAQKAKNDQNIKWGDDYNKYNIWMMRLNGAFIALHFLQTHLFYDGLAGDVPEVTALASVAILLVVVLILEIPRRGLFFGKVKGFPYLEESFIPFVRKYHAYVISFGLVYNFWYHPMEGTFAHLCGFFYQFIIFWQSSIFFNTEHKNRYWTLIVELMVWFHGALTAVFQRSGDWLMFTYGFFFLFVITQFWGVPIVQSFVNKSTRNFIIALVGILVTFFALAVLGYYLSGNISKMFSIFFIPSADYLVVGLFYVWFIISYWLLKLVGKIIHGGNEEHSYTLIECALMAFMVFLINVTLLAVLPIFIGG